MRKLIGALLTLTIISPATAGAQQIGGDAGIQPQSEDRVDMEPRPTRNRDGHPDRGDQRPQRMPDRQPGSPRDAGGPAPARADGADPYAGRPNVGRHGEGRPDNARVDGNRPDDRRPDRRGGSDRGGSDRGGSDRGGGDRGGDAGGYRGDRGAPPPRGIPPRDVSRDGPRDGRRSDWTRSQFDRRDDRWTQSRFQDRSAWNRGWRSDGRYDWNRYREANRGAYRLPRYYGPQGGGGGYRRVPVGIALQALFLSRNYWIADPYTYRLPEAYGPYRWVRYYDDALLVDLRSGIVVDAVYGIFW